MTWYIPSSLLVLWFLAGFERPVQRPRRQQPLPPHLRPLLQECWPLWELLRKHVLRPLPPSGAAVPRPLHSAPAPATAEGAAQGGGSLGASAQHAKHGGTHAYMPNARNDDILIGMRDGVTGWRAPNPPSGGA